MGILAVGIAAPLFAGEEPDSRPREEQTAQPERMRQATEDLSELLKSIIRLSEEHPDLPAEVREPLNQLANRARELKPTLDMLCEHLGVLEKPASAPAFPPEINEEMRRLESQLDQVEKEIRQIKETKGEPTPEMRARLEKLRARREELKSAAENLRGKTKTRSMQPPGMMPPRIEGELRIFQLEHVDSPYVAEILKQLLPPGSTVVPDVRQGKLFVMTAPNAYGRAERVIQELDKPHPAPPPERREPDRPGAERRERPRYDYELPQAPERKSSQPPSPPVKSGRTVGTLVERKEEGFAVLPEGSPAPVQFQYPTLMQDKKPVPSEEFLRKIKRFQLGDTIVVEWNEVEGSKVAVGIAPAPEKKERAKPNKEREEETTILK